MGGAVALRRETIQPPVLVQHPVIPGQDGTGERAQLRARQTAQVRCPVGVHVPYGPGRLQSRRQPSVLRYENHGHRQQEDRRRRQQQASDVAQRTQTIRYRY